MICRLPLHLHGHTCNHMLRCVSQINNTFALYYEENYNFHTKTDTRISELVPPTPSAPLPRHLQRGDNMPAMTRYNNILYGVHIAHPPPGPVPVTAAPPPRCKSLITLPSPPPHPAPPRHAPADPAAPRCTSPLPHPTPALHTPVESLMPLVVTLGSARNVCCFLFLIRGNFSVRCDAIDRRI